MAPKVQVDLEVDLPNDFSDGDKSTWPQPPYRRVDDMNLRSSIARQWFEERGLGIQSINQRFNRLPAGYTHWEIPKPDGSGVTYKRVFGHPSKRFFDSSKTFFPHFKWLMGGGSGQCACKLCGKGLPLAERREFKPRARTSNSYNVRTHEATPELITARTRPRYDDRVLVDEEGTPDIYRAMLQRLHKGVRMNEPIRESQSMDWRAERESLYRALTRISLQAQFLPRVGELVLWTPELNSEVALNPETGEYQMYDFGKGRYLGFPQWMAGVVTQVPEEPGDLQDIVEDVAKAGAVNVSGYRVEAFPDPNNDTNKSLSKHYKYVTLRQIRPLSYWQAMLLGSKEEDMHPSIKNALTISSSISLVEKFKFRGEWPNAEIFCKGIYLGSELLLVGDAIRIMPEGKASACTDILVITSIRVHLSELTPTNAFESQSLSCKSSIHIYGHAYTTTATRSYVKDSSDGGPLNATEISTVLPWVALSNLRNWYRLHPPKTRYEISFDRILGRLHEPSATCLWLRTSASTTPTNTILSHDLSTVRSSRQYSRSTDARIPTGRSWFWADTRAQALAIETFNGREVGAYDGNVRNHHSLRTWRANLRVIDGLATEQDLVETSLTQKPGKARGRRPGAKLVDGKVIYPGDPGYDRAAGRAKSIPNKLVDAAFGGSADESEDEVNVTETSDGMDDVRSTEQPPVQALSTPSRSRMVDVSMNDDGDVSSEDPLPPHVERGGTEETDGGDYNPRLEDFQKASRPEKRMKF